MSPKNSRIWTGPWTNTDLSKLKECSSFQGWKKINSRSAGVNQKALEGYIKDDGITKVKHLARDQLENTGTGRKLQESKMKKVVV